MKKIAFITGATSGIGKACAKTFAEQGYNLILCGRRSERLSQLKEELISKFPIQILCSSFDVQNQSEVTNAILSIPDEWKNIDVLINNAGLSLGRDNFSDASIQDWETMMQTNVMGVIYVTKALMDSIVQHQTHIINIGSIAAKEVYENGNGYCASKAALDSLSKSMRIDLLPKGVKVTAIHPGAVETEFSKVRYKGDQEKADAVYKGFTPLTGNDIAQTVLFAVSQPAHVCINELTVMPTAQASAFHFHKK
jgi:3-hydroxy acid dehydrogenase/malonic semialdehyde reductase